jgi:ribosome recycling factor
MQHIEQKMQKSLASFDEELKKYRAGRAHPQLLESVRVLYYGQNVPLTQVASVLVEGPLLLLIKPWEKHLIPVIERAIIAANLGLNPSNAGDVIRVPLPPLSEERRKDLIKKVRMASEQSKVSIRNIRRDANNEYKEQLKAKIITEDQERRSQDTVQKLTDQYIHKIDQAVQVKEADLLDF